MVTRRRSAGGAGNAVSPGCGALWMKLKEYRLLDNLLGVVKELRLMDCPVPT
jgi:hypothetical protein